MNTWSEKQKGHIIGCLLRKKTTFKGISYQLDENVSHTSLLFLIVLVVCAVFIWRISQGFPALLRRPHSGA